MQLRHLRYFVTIVEAGSFSRAATLVHVAQPALSQQIAELEQELDLSLLQRSARGVRPTVAGQVLYREAVSILKQMDELPGKVRSSTGAVQGVVRLGMSSTLATVLSGPFMEACRTALPKVTLRLVTADSVTVTRRIEAESLDLGIVFEGGPTPGFVRTPLFRHRLFLIHRDKLLDESGSVTLSDIAQLPLVMPAHPNVTRTVLDRAFAGAALTPLIAAEADTAHSMLSALASGLGSTILPKGDMSDVAGHASLHAAPIDPPLYLTASVISAVDAPLTAAGEAVRALLLSFTEQRLTRLPPPGVDWIGEPKP
jgi:LysR family transcriptional regulator, nitrogen assimilation regulatory protein